MDLMKSSGYNILRVGMAITFLWIGILILKSPEDWGGLITPWATDLLFVPIKQVMISTAILDIVLGALLLLDLFVWPAAFFAALHLTMVLITTGITDVTVRDIGLLVGCLALMADTWPKKFKLKLTK